MNVVFMGYVVIFYFPFLCSPLNHSPWLQITWIKLLVIVAGIAQLVQCLAMSCTKCLIPSTGRNFSLHHNIQTASVAHPFSCLVDTGIWTAPSLFRLDQKVQWMIKYFVIINLLWSTPLAQQDYPSNYHLIWTWIELYDFIEEHFRKNEDQIAWGFHHTPWPNDNTPTSYSGSPEFKSWAREWLSWLKIFSWSIQENAAIV